jgi:hypothetical protein
MSDRGWVSASAAALSAAIGIWLMAAPAVLGTDEPAASFDHVVGPIAASFGTIALWRAVRVTNRANVLTGVVLLASVFVDGRPVESVANAIVCGVALVLLGLTPIRGEDRFAGGWLGLVRHLAR